MSKPSLSSLSFVVAALWGASLTAAAQGREQSLETHRFAAQGVPLNGGFVFERGLVPGDKPELFSVRDSRQKQKEQLLAYWGVKSLPAGPFEGLARDGRRVEVRLTGFRMNEFGPVFTYRAHEAGKATAEVPAEDVALFWTGHLSWESYPAKRIEIPVTDREVLESECAARGFEMRYHLKEAGAGGTNSGPNGGKNSGRKGNFGSVWYLDPLEDNQRADIASPKQQDAMLVEVMAPSADADFVLAGCWYASASSGWDVRYRGPVIAYDLREHRVVWREAIDLDEHFSFLRAGEEWYMLHFGYSNVGETTDWSLESLAVRDEDIAARSYDGKPGPDRDFLIEGDRSVINGTITWFFDE
jgi:hypothetical protein